MGALGNTQDPVEWSEGLSIKANVPFRVVVSRQCGCQR